MLEEILMLSAVRFQSRDKIPGCWAVPGVYAIRHKPSGRLYVGSAAGVGGIRSRLYTHRKTLRAGSHKNSILQNFWNKHSEGEFEFMVVCLCAPTRVRDVETALIKSAGTLQPKGFNINPGGGELWGYHISEERKENLRLKNQLPYELQLGDQIFRGENLTKFCRERGLHQGALTQVNLGRKPQYKGWTKPGFAKPPALVIDSSNFLREIPHHTKAKFAAAHGLNSISFTALCSGRLRYLKGWRSLRHDATWEEARSYQGLSRGDVCRKNGAKHQTRPHHPDQSHRGQ